MRDLPAGALGAAGAEAGAAAAGAASGAGAAGWYCEALAMLCAIAAVLVIGVPWFITANTAATMSCIDGALAAAAAGGAAAIAGVL